MLHKTASSVLLADSTGFLDFDQECHSVEKCIRQGTEGSSWPIASQELRGARKELNPAHNRASVAVVPSPAKPPGKLQPWPTLWWWSERDAEAEGPAMLYPDSWPTETVG